MKTLSDLFDGGDRGGAPGESGSSGRVDANDARLAALLQRPPRRAIDPAAEAARLRAAINDGAPSQSVSVSAHKSAGPVRRPRGRTDWLAASIGLVAVAVIVAAAAVAAVQLNGAGPASGALESLKSDEASLADAVQSVGTSVSRVEVRIADGYARIEQIEPAVAALEGAADEAARAAVRDAAIAYRAGLDAIVLPELPDAVRRGDVDESSLPAVAAQLNEVRERAVLLAQSAAELRAIRQTVIQLATSFHAHVQAFGAGFPATATVIAAENARAAQPYRDAVIAEAAGIVAAQAQGRTGATAMLTYARAVEALRGDHARALAEAVPGPRPIRRPGGSVGGGATAPAEPAVPAEPTPMPSASSDEPPAPDQPAPPDDPAP